MKKTITITLHMREIIYDVQNKTYLRGRSKQDATPDIKANMQANDDDENLNQVLRSIGNAYGTLKSTLSEYIDESGTTASNVLQPNSDIIVVLTMPSNYNAAGNDVVATGLHKFIVNSAIFDWFVLTSPSDAEVYAPLATAAMADVVNAINRRLRPERPTS